MLIILEEFLNFLFQNLFINIDDSNGQSNCMDVFLNSKTNFCLNTNIKSFIHVAFHNTFLENFKSRDESGY